MRALFYLIAVILSVPLTVLVALMLVGAGVRQGLFRQEDISYMLALGAAGGLLFWVVNRLNNRAIPAERRLMTHARQSALVYVTLVASGIWLVARMHEANGLQYALVALLCAASLYAIVSNAAFLYLRAKSLRGTGRVT